MLILFSYIFFENDDLDNVQRVIKPKGFENERNDQVKISKLSMQNHRQSTKESDVKRVMIDRPLYPS